MPYSRLVGDLEAILGERRGVCYVPACIEKRGDLAIPDP
jgi:hypothetical protein